MHNSKISGLGRCQSRDLGLAKTAGIWDAGIAITKIIDKIFVSHHELFVCTTFKSIVKTKHSAVLLQPCASYPATYYPSTRKRVTVYDRRPQHIACLRRAISEFDWQSVLSCSVDISVSQSVSQSHAMSGTGKMRIVDLRTCGPAYV